MLKEPFMILLTYLGNIPRKIGLLQDIFDLIRMNFSYDLRRCPDGNCGAPHADGVWSGIVEEIYNWTDMSYPYSSPVESFIFFGSVYELGDGFHMRKTYREVLIADFSDAIVANNLSFDYGLHNYVVNFDVHIRYSES